MTSIQKLNIQFSMNWPCAGSKEQKRRRETKKGQTQPLHRLDLASSFLVSLLCGEP